MRKPKLVVLTGAGMSAESGVKTFRDHDGLWEGHDVMEVASYSGWLKNPALVLDFYNQRHRQLKEVRPNDGHFGLARLEEHFDVTIITQNVDDLHERAGSTNVIHLHGELTKKKSTMSPNDIEEWGDEDLTLESKCRMGGQYRPAIVWFEEAVPMMVDARRALRGVEFFAVVGTSLVVYPAANLVHDVPLMTPKFVVDPKIPAIGSVANVTKIQKPATTGVAELTRLLMEKLV